MTPPVKLSRAFSLVEVAMAVGIVAFGLIAIFGLLPISLTTTRTISSEGMATDILTGLAEDLQVERGTPADATPLYGLAVGTDTNGSVLFNQAGLPASDPSEAAYKADWRRWTTNNGASARIIHLSVGWPATNTQGQIEALVPISHNP